MIFTDLYLTLPLRDLYLATRKIFGDLKKVTARFILDTGRNVDMGPMKRKRKRKKKQRVGKTDCW